MNTTPTATIDRPAWLTEDAWPWPVSALTTPDGPIAYTDTGGNGPVVLLVHAGMWSFVWRDLMLDLAVDHRCITIDAPGNGLSTRSDASGVTLSAASHAVGAVVDALDLRDLTLVFHDLGGSAAVAAMGARADRVAALVAVNTFAWTPDTRLLKFGLSFMGGAPMRELDAATGFFAAASSTRFGVGRHWDAETRAVFRHGVDRRSVHRYFADARRAADVTGAADAALRGPFAERPLLTVFGRRNDYFGFQPRWLERFPGARQEQVDGGNHFPMCDDPAAVAGWMRRLTRRRDAGSGEPV
ncbi:alpha/beta fold hydrolase [Agromyces bauzanensis]|uniref:AB hydrolase-1 domain-containing protein n=1 Tax=Agromyces bauzanensis TaxID=1308924 RepID=A0A917PL34_9MICO|nr:alpha/beta fold hydrolase [Agromyces bauzanensis]GGJ82914.1 hypothetical protein GCM10011372_21520 [Agromyces bauzanensis]